MNNTTRTILVSALVAVVVALVVAYFRPANTIVKEIREIIKEQMGAVSGPSIDFESWTVNGVVTHFRRMAMITSTTTPCAIRSPDATTTIISATAMTTVGTTTATVWTMASSTTAFATTTRLAAQRSVPSGDQMAFHVGWDAAGSDNTATTTKIMRPLDWIVVSTQGVAQAAGMSELRGTCTAVFQEL